MSNIIIRDAVLDDMDDIIRLGTAFFHSSGWGDFTDIDPTSFRVTLNAALLNEDFIIHIAEKDGVVIGGIGMVLAPIWFSGGTMAQEMFWYVDPEHRGMIGHRLYKGMELHITEIGVDLIVMVGLNRERLLDRYLTKQGFSIMEQNYVMKIKGKL